MSKTYWYSSQGSEPVQLEVPWDDETERLPPTSIMFGSTNMENYLVYTWDDAQPMVQVSQLTLPDTTMQNEPPVIITPAPAGHIVEGSGPPSTLPQPAEGGTTPS